MASWYISGSLICHLQKKQNIVMLPWTTPWVLSNTTFFSTKKELFTLKDNYFPADLSKPDNLLFQKFRCSSNSLITGSILHSGKMNKPTTNSDYVIYVGNLPLLVTNDELRNYFGKYGAIKNVTLNRGFGLVEFYTEIAARYAIQKEHNATFRNRIIMVRMASTSQSFISNKSISTNETFASFPTFPVEINSKQAGIGAYNTPAQKSNSGKAMGSTNQFYNPNNDNSESFALMSTFPVQINGKQGSIGAYNTPAQKVNSSKAMGSTYQSLNSTMHKSSAPYPIQVNTQQDFGTFVNSLPATLANSSKEMSSQEPSESSGIQDNRTGRRQAQRNRRKKFKALQGNVATYIKARKVISDLMNSETHPAKPGTSGLSEKPSKAILPNAKQLPTDDRYAMHGTNSKNRKELQDADPEYLKVFIVNENDPEEKIPDSLASPIHSSLMNELMDFLETRPASIPTFKGYEFVEGRSLITCSNLFSLEFLTSTIRKIGLNWEGVRLNVVKQNKSSWFLQVKLFLSNFDEEPAKAIKILDLQNPLLGIDEWKLFHHQNFQPKGLLLVMGIPGYSAEFLKKSNGIVSFGFDQVKVEHEDPRQH